MCPPVANIKSQIKRNRTNEKRRLRNRAAKSEIKTRIKVALRAAETGDETAGEYLRQAAKRLDKAAARGIIHANQAANRKSALMHHTARLQASLEAPSDEGEAEATLGETVAMEAATSPASSQRARPERAALRPRLPRRGRRAKAQLGAGEEAEAGEDVLADEAGADAGGKADGAQAEDTEDVAAPASPAEDEQS